MSPASKTDVLRYRIAWSVLILLLLATWGLVATYDRSSWPSLVGDEATYAMQAASLAEDLDLRYGRWDYDRFVAAWGRPPEGLILQSRDDGERLVFGKPFFYAAVAAPFVAINAVRGPALANAFLLTLAALALGRALGRRVGPWGPLWAAVAIFASVSFGYVFWAHAEIFLFTCAALAFSLATGGGGGLSSQVETVRRRAADREPGSPPPPLPNVWGGSAAGEPKTSVSAGGMGTVRDSLRFFLCGLCLGAVIAFRPFYLPLLLPLALLLPRYRSRRQRVSAEEELEATLSGTLAGRAGVALRPTRALAWAALGVVAALALSSGVQWASGGSWSGYAGERQGFYQRTGFPDVDFPAEEWRGSIERWGNTSWVHQGMFDLQTSPSLLLWNSLYFFVGENLGVLPYFLPFVPLLLLAGGPRRTRFLAVLAVALAVAAFFLLRPHNFYGGAGALANRYFLPLYPTLLVLGTRRLPAWGAVLTALLAAPFLAPLWSAPAAFPVAPGGDGYAYVSSVAREYLPWETTQSHLPRASEDVMHGGLWLRFADSALAPAGKGVLSLTLGRPAELYIGSPRALTRVGLSLGEGAQAPQLKGAEITQELFRPDGSAGYVLELDDVHTLHPMWWTDKPFFIYRLVLSADPAPGAGDRVEARLQSL
ncbi:MAG: hypothetical protein AAGD01_16340 [Acidobacteriota bacterium]